MGKKLIDANVLLEWVEKNKEYGELAGVWESDIVHADDIVEKIQSLAIDFDDQGWCWDVDKIKKYCLIDILAEDEHGNRVRVCSVTADENDFIIHQECKFLSEYPYNNKVIAWRHIPSIPQKDNKKEKL